MTYVHVLDSESNIIAAGNAKRAYAYVICVQIKLQSSLLIPQSYLHNTVTADMSADDQFDRIAENSRKCALSSDGADAQVDLT